MKRRSPELVRPRPLDPPRRLDDAALARVHGGCGCGGCGCSCCSGGGGGEFVPPDVDTQVTGH